MKKILLIILLVIPFAGNSQNISSIIIDDSIATEASLKSINPNDIESISILRNKALPISLKDSVVLQITTKEKEEYEAIVLDPGFDTFLATQPSKQFFSKTKLKAKNTLAVIEWNYRHKNPLFFNPNIYEVHIDYDQKTDYGLDVEYTLYMFFRYMEKENNITLI